MTFIVNTYQNFFDSSIKDFNEIGTVKLPLPKFPELYIIKICNDVIPFLQHDRTLLKLEGEFFIVGDLHGNIKDLLRIFACAGSPTEKRYIFLGDYVDRGEYSVEVITLLFALKICRPNDIFLLRGNHEFEDINAMYGFKEQCTSEYSLSLFQRFNDCFTYLPLAAVVNKQTFIVHGGISVHLKNIEQIEDIPRPAKNFENTEFRQLVLDMMWSDPTADHKHFFPSLRGIGTLFGYSAIKTFLANNDLTRIIRGHQCVYDGVEDFCYSKLYTVFSSSNYSQDMDNKCGIIKMFGDNSIKCYNFPPLRIHEKGKSVFKLFDARETHSSNSINHDFQEVSKYRRSSFGNEAMITKPLQARSRTLMLRKTQLPRIHFFADQI